MENLFKNTCGLKVVIGTGFISMHELAHLKKGDVIRTDGTAGKPHCILINDKPLFQGEVIIINDIYGVLVSKNSGFYPKEFIGKKNEAGEILTTEIILSDAEYQFNDIINASIYSAISLDKIFKAHDDSNVSLYIQGNKIAEGRLVIIDEYFGIEITKMLFDLTADEKIEARSSGYMIDKNAFQIKEYDFRKPDRFTFIQILKMKDIHITALKNMKYLLPEINDYSVSTVDQLAFYEAIDLIKNDYVYSIIKTGSEYRFPELLEKGNKKIIIEKKDSINKFGDEYKKNMERFFEGIKNRCSKEFLICLKKHSALGKINNKDSIRELIINPLRNAWKDYADIKTADMLITDDFDRSKLIPDKDMIIIVQISSKEKGNEMIIIYPFIFLENILEALDK
ncbi:MAG: FliM/FliN family flagellar motor switch protein [Spirochaetes bacterium]|nr:FliM/FliN family flagellar motor switch protein [Spirochaetota bacterium]